MPNHYKLCLKAKSKRTVYTIKANSAQAAFLPKSIARLDSSFCLRASPHHFSEVDSDGRWIDFQNGRALQLAAFHLVESIIGMFKWEGLGGRPHGDFGDNLHEI